jgi:hypothetical protein
MEVAMTQKALSNMAKRRKTDTEIDAWIRDACAARGIPCTLSAEPEPAPMAEFDAVMREALTDLDAWEAAQAPVPDPIRVILPPGASVQIVGAAFVEVVGA